MTENDIKKAIQEWQFAVCPTEQEEPFFWRWNEHGLDVLASGIKELIENAIKEKK
jgi:hypothetical protein